MWGSNGALTLSLPEELKALEGVSVVQLASGTAHTALLSDLGACYTRGYPHHTPPLTPLGRGFMAPWATVTPRTVACSDPWPPS